MEIIGIGEDVFLSPMSYYKWNGEISDFQVLY